MEDTADEDTAATKIQATWRGFDVRKNASQVKIVCRCRPVMPWEEGDEQVVFFDGSKLGLKENDKITWFEFTDALDMSTDNLAAWERICKHSAQGVLEGFNAVVIAYGQTGTGKTFTLVGKENLGVKGLIPMTMCWFIEQGAEVSLSVVEAYGTKVMNIDIFDLADKEKTCFPRWDQKIGDNYFNNKNSKRWKIKNEKEAFRAIKMAHSRSHYAATGKNPDSSRGHTVFILVVTTSDTESRFVFADLAGSEGDSALTAELKRSVSSDVFETRRREGGVINMGLTDLQMVFADLSTKGKMNNVKGVGLRQILHGLIDTHSNITALFCVSPSRKNFKPTKSTLRFAKAAARVKTSVQKTKKKGNSQKKQLEAYRKLVAERNKYIAELEAENKTLLKELESAGTKRDRPSVMESGLKVSVLRKESDLAAALEDSSPSTEQNCGMDAKLRASFDAVHHKQMAKALRTSDATIGQDGEIPHGLIARRVEEIERMLEEEDKHRKEVEDHHQFVVAQLTELNRAYAKKLDELAE